MGWVLMILYLVSGNIQSVTISTGTKPACVEARKYAMKHLQEHIDEGRAQVTECMMKRDMPRKAAV